MSQENEIEIVLNMSLGCTLRGVDASPSGQRDSRRGRYAHFSNTRFPPVAERVGVGPPDAKAHGPIPEVGAIQC